MEAEEEAVVGMEQEGVAVLMDMQTRRRITRSLASGTASMRPILVDSVLVTAAECTAALDPLVMRDIPVVLVVLLGTRDVPCTIDKVG